MIHVREIVVSRFSRGRQHGGTRWRTQAVRCRTMDGRSEHHALSGTNVGFTLNQLAETKPPQTFLEGVLCVIHAPNSLANNPESHPEQHTVNRIYHVLAVSLFNRRGHASNWKITVSIHVAGTGPRIDSTHFSLLSKRSSLTHRQLRAYNTDILGT